jgi:hypothetical protein
MRAMRKRLGFLGEVYDQRKAGRYARAARISAATGAGVLAFAGKRSRSAAIGGSALVLAGELALRFSVFHAGKQSAHDPAYVVRSQREPATR